MQELLKELKEKNIAISLAKSDLRIKFNGEALPDEILRKIRENKEVLISYLRQQDDYGEEKGIYPAASKEDYVLSSSQRRLWVLSQLEGGNVAYNVPGAYELEGELDEDALEASFMELIARHESLRTVFVEREDGEVRSAP